MGTNIYSLEIDIICFKSVSGLSFRCRLKSRIWNPFCVVRQVWCETSVVRWCTVSVKSKAGVVCGGCVAWHEGEGCGVWWMCSVTWGWRVRRDAGVGMVWCKTCVVCLLVGASSYFLFFFYLLFPLFFFLFRWILMLLLYTLLDAQPSSFRYPATQHTSFSFLCAEGRTTFILVATNCWSTLPRVVPSS